LQPDIFEPIDRLPPRCNKWLIVDYPQDWFYPIADRLDIVSRFSEENIFFTASSGLTRLAPDIFYHIVQRSRLPMEACMVVDAVTPRAVQAIRHGLTSTIFVSSWRLTRDFKLRQLIS
jgi:FMN phosphatase YigB (HAD superfamily)